MSAHSPSSVYFVGIGGIGMSALARYYRATGARVAGYDRSETALTRALVEEGIEVHYEDDPEQVPPDVDLAVYTPAVPETHAELNLLRTSGPKPIKRAAALGLLSRRHRTIGIAGTHGKTTTATMAAYLMREAGTDAVAFLGGISANYGTNYLAGEGEWLVVEADEYDRSFLHLHPEVAVVTYVEPDHLDIYGDASAFEESFRDYCRQVSREGGVVVTKPHVAKVLASGLHGVRVETYGIGEEDLDWSAHDVRVDGLDYVFDLTTPAGQTFVDIRLAMPGHHNVENALAAIAASVAAGVPVERCVELLPKFRGVQRRFEYLGEWRGARVISDYAHHPTEVKAAVKSILALSGSYRVVGIFQPHLYTRTRDFAEAFAASLHDLQEVVLLDLYPARELPIEGISSMTIFAHIECQSKYLVSKSEAPGLLKVLDADVLLFMGAGDIDDLARGLVSAG